jgi:phosphoglucosamine mutase
MVSDRIARDEVVPGVVGTLMTNMAVEVALKRKGIAFIRSKVGDRYVLEALQEKSWLLGGEGSGHLLALDKHTTGDGLISALQVLQACVATGQTMAQLLADVTLFPQVLINVRIAKDQNWKDSPQLASALKEAESTLADTGRVLIRASGTEPLVRVMVEAKDPAMAQACAEKLAATLR